jgi:L-lactate dehydrogenase complex protein LldF
MAAEFKQDIAKALENPNLVGALGRFSEAYVGSRAKAYDGIDFEKLRDEIVAVKGHGAAHLEELAAEFTANATRAGAKVFRASSPEEVRAYIANLCREKGVKRIVKSKSMATEEVHLNQFLEGMGIRVKESDLGEWIIQLAGQKPSHMVMPAIHMTKEQVADIFSKEVDERLAADIPRLVKVARNALREEFLQADLGISGANIAVAETGTLCILTNEGNARLTTTLPPIHVAVVGVEKLIAKFSEVTPIVRALPKSATGQLLTSYFTMITGAAPNVDGSPKELHIVLMDNQRTAMAKDPKFEQALRCIRCASCSNVCPVYRLVGGHVFGGVYTGGIGAILAAWFDALKASDDIQGLCIQCGNCVQVCPSRIDIPGLIVDLRRRLAKERGQGVVQKGIFKVVNNRRLFHSMLRVASKAQKPFAKDGMIRHLPLFMSGLADFRSLPAIADVPFRDRVKEIRQPQGLKEKAVFYAGCLIDFAYPEMGESLVRVLNKAGVEVVFPDEQTCCGAPARYNGAYDVAANNALDNLAALKVAGADYVVSACPTCTVALKHDFADTLREEGHTEAVAEAEALAAKVIDFSSLVKRLVDQGRLKLKPGQELPSVTYHDSCHLKRSLGVRDEPRELLAKAGHEVKEMFESDMCCGMGGSYSMKFPEISKPILERKLQNIRKTGAEVVAMDCPGCVMQIKGGLDKSAAPLPVKHVVELLAQRLE